MTHTPGHKVTADPQRNFIVYNIWSNGQRLARDVPDKATADLFAAAPDLLEALEEFVAQTYSFGSMKNTRTKAIHAINKAKGE